MSFKEVNLQDIPERHPVVAFAKFWQQAAGGASVARWERFDPADHPRTLPWIMLLKREPGPEYAGGPPLRYAVCGTSLSTLFGFSYQGKLFGEDLPPDAVVRRRAEFDRVMAGSGPLFSHTELPIPNKDFHLVYRGVFAFENGGDEVDRICVVLAPAAEKI